MRLKPTVKDLKEGLQKAIDGGLSEGAAITWAEQADRDREIDEGRFVPAGTLLFGVQQIEDGVFLDGILFVPPTMLTDRPS